MQAVEETHLDMVPNRAGNPAVLISHPTGNQNVRNALRSLAEREMLAEFCTTVAVSPQSQWLNLLPRSVKDQLLRRSYSDAPRQRVNCFPFRETVRLIARSSPFEKLLCSGERPFSVIGMHRHFDGQVARRLRQVRPDVVYAYEGSALQTFREAKKLGIVTMYEQPSSYWYWVRNLLSEEAQRYPEFAGLLPNLGDSDAHLAWKDEEISLADYVFVPSEHVRRTLAGAVPDKKIRVIGYGAPNPRERKPVASDPDQPLKVLFVGGLTQHKGIGYLLDAVAMVERKVDLTLVGRRQPGNARLDSACRRWRWIESLPHDQILDLMAESEVLVLPSFGEGFGLVVTEALACGLPVIVTPNVGAADLICNGQNGFIVPLRSAESIAGCLKRLASNREELREMSRQAQATASERGWETYRAAWANAVRESC